MEAKLEIHGSGAILLAGILVVDLIINIAKFIFFLIEKLP